MIQQTASTVRLAAEARSTLTKITEQRSREEICGLFFGGMSGQSLVVNSVSSVPNRAQLPSVSFRMLAKDIRAVSGHCANVRYELLGYFHTHPVGRNYPSSTDWRSIKSKVGLHAIIDRFGRARFFLNIGMGRIVNPVLEISK